MSRYSEELLDHARHPHNFGRDRGADAVGRADNQGRPPIVELYLRFKEDRIASAVFHTSGCGVIVAACSAITDIVKGASCDKSCKITAEDVTNYLDGVPADKRFCVDVAVAALRDALLQNPCRESTGMYE